METIIEYRCEICSKKYNTAKEALNCEAKGLPDNSKLPIGLMFAYYHHGYIGIFAIAEVRPSRDKHALDFSSWACRTYPYPSNTLGKNTCGGSGDSFIETNGERWELFKQNHIIPKSEVRNPEYLRMVDYLESNNITPQYYNEEGLLIAITH